MCGVAFASQCRVKLQQAGWSKSYPRACCLSWALNKTSVGAAMTSDINYNQEEESATRNLQIRNIHAPHNLIIKGTLLWWRDGALVRAMRGWPQFLRAGVYGVKRSTLKQSPGWGSWGWGGQRLPSHAQENFSTIKESLINLTYVPKVHMRRMIPIRLKPNSAQAQLHISSAILLFVFTGPSLTRWPFFLIKPFF